MLDVFWKFITNRAMIAALSVLFGSILQALTEFWETIGGNVG